MNPEWSKRAGAMLESPYWKCDVETEEEFNEYVRLHEDELDPLRDAVQHVESYDDLEEDMQAIFDRAERAAKEWEEFANQDTAGYGRFHDTWSITKEPEPDATLALQPGERYFDEPPKGKGWVFVRAGKFGGHIYRTKNAPAPALTQPEPAAAPSLSKEQLSKGFDVINKIAYQRFNLAPLPVVRKALAEAGFDDRAQQDALIMELRRENKVEATGIEGRHGISAEEREASIREGDRTLGYLLVRGGATMSVDDTGHEHRGRGPGGGQFSKGAGGASTAARTPPALADQRDDAETVPDDLELPDGILQKPGMLARVAHMVRVAKAKLTAAMLGIDDTAVAVIPNAYDHARNALLSTALPGVPVNDIAMCLSKVVSWAWHKVKAKRAAGGTLAMGDGTDATDKVIELAAIMYEMAGLPEGTPLPTRGAVEAAAAAKEAGAPMALSAPSAEDERHDRLERMLERTLEALSRPTAPPVIHIAPPAVTVNVAPQQPMRTKVNRDQDGNIVDTEQVPVEIPEKDKP